MFNLVSIQSIFIMALVYVAIYDLYYKKIPNNASVLIVILGFIYNFYLMGNAGFKTSLYGLSAGLLVGLFFYRLTGLGAGDVKLFAAIGCFVCYPDILVVIAYSYIASAILGGIFQGIRFLFLKRHNKTSLVEKKTENLLSQRIPMAPGISIATIYVLLR